MDHDVDPKNLGYMGAALIIKCEDEGGGEGFHRVGNG